MSSLEQIIIAPAGSFEDKDRVFAAALLYLINELIPDDRTARMIQNRMNVHLKALLTKHNNKRRKK